MIEKDIMQYLQTKTDIITPLGGANKICNIQAPVGAQMMWIIIEASGGQRRRISATRGEEHNNVRIGLDAGPSQWRDGRAIMEKVKAHLENLRGTLGDADDLYIECNAVSGYPGLNGAYRYHLTARCRFTYDWNTVRPST